VGHRKQVVSCATRVFCDPSYADHVIGGGNRLEHGGLGYDKAPKQNEKDT
jgi:hypothetical protein